MCRAVVPGAPLLSEWILSFRDEGGCAAAEDGFVDDSTPGWRLPCSRLRMTVRLLILSSPASRGTSPARLSSLACNAKFDL